MGNPQKRLEESLAQLNVEVVGKQSGSVGGKSVNERISEEKEANPGAGSEDDEGTIKETPVKAKITLSQSKMLGQLPGRATDSLLNVAKRDNGKIQVRFKSIGSIDQLRPAVFKISKESQFSSITKFLEKRLRLPNVYCYLANSIVPNPDDRIGNLFDLFKSGNELIVSYCNVVAFG